MEIGKIEPGPFDAVRMLAVKLLQHIDRSQAFADEILDRSFSASPELRPLDRAFVTEMVLGVLRWRGRLDWILRQVLKTPQKKLNTQVHEILRLGVYQLFFMDRVPPSAAINESVRLTKSIFKDEKISGFVNGVLRTVLRKKGELPFPSPEKDPVTYLSHFFSHPRWLVDRWFKEFGFETARGICAANNRRPPWTLRVNTLKTSKEKLAIELMKAGIHSHPAPFSYDGLIAEQNPFYEGEILFQNGLFFLQDEASQIVTFLLQPQPGELILDACAAPGGKGTHIAQVMGNQGKIIAIDLQEEKIRMIEENAYRLGVKIIEASPADARNPLSFPRRPVFDRILVDAPCSGLGTLHRNPEAKWRRKPEDIHRLRSLQLALLQNVSSPLKPGGVLVYSTCTLTTEENDQVVDGFLKGNPNFMVEDLHSFMPSSWHPLLDEKGFYRTYPRMLVEDEEYRMDGFFAARIRKKGQ
jgi:16S rRNA (cytosine967-C5)-methyltransferase